MRQTVFGRVGLPLVVLVNTQPIFGTCPDPVAIHQHGEHVIVGQAVGGREVFKSEARHCGGSCAAEVAA